jgi:hypothetical protein
MSTKICGYFRGYSGVIHNPNNGVKNFELKSYA